MKLIITVVSVGLALFLAGGTASAQEAGAATRTRDMEKIDVPSMVDEVEVPIHVLMSVQSDKPGHAVIEAKAGKLAHETTYRLRVSTDSNKSLDDTYIVFDTKWRKMSEFDVPKPYVPEPSDTGDDDEKDEEDENKPEDDQEDDDEPATEEEAPAVIEEPAELPDTSEPADDTEDDNEPNEEVDDGSATDDNDDDTVQSQPDDPDVQNEAPG